MNSKSVSWKVVSVVPRGNVHSVNRANSNQNILKFFLKFIVSIGVAFFSVSASGKNDFFYMCITFFDRYTQNIFSGANGLGFINSGRFTLCQNQRGNPFSIIIRHPSKENLTDAQWLKLQQQAEQANVNVARFHFNPSDRESSDQIICWTNEIESMDGFEWYYPNSSNSDRYNELTRTINELRNKKLRRELLNEKELSLAFYHTVWTGVITGVMPASAVGHGLHSLIIWGRENMESTNTDLHVSLAVFCKRKDQGDCISRKSLKPFRSACKKSLDGDNFASLFQSDTGWFLYKRHEEINNSQLNKLNERLRDILTAPHRGDHPRSKTFYERYPGETEGAFASEIQIAYWYDYCPKK